ncbi:MAG: hypothetical protein ACRD1N_01485 [Terriglobia bacterium]
MACICSAEYIDGCNGSTYDNDVTGSATWYSSDTGVANMDSSVPYQVDASAPGESNITASFSDCGQYTKTTCSCNYTNNGSTSSTANVDSLAFTITSGGAPTDSSGIISDQQFGLQIQADLPAASGGGVDSSFAQQNVTFTLTNVNTSVGESAPSSVNFSSGAANTNVTIVQASGLTVVGYFEFFEP